MSNLRKLYTVLGVLVGIWSLRRTLLYVYELCIRRVVIKRRNELMESNKQLFSRLREQLAENKLSSEETDKITGLSLAQLKEELKQDYVSPTAVLAAYQHKALAAHHRTNCLMHPIPEAVCLARELEHGDNRGLLYGIPVSIKDIIPVKGYTHSAGMAMLLSETAEEDCGIVKVLKKQGAIPFVKTTNPQGSIAWHCVNPITGTTTNPEDADYSPGGSSSGEGALIGCGGAPIGIGTDAGGSVRCPAIWSGCCSLKPTSNRLSHVGTLSNYISGQELMWVTSGPMAREVNGLVLCMKALCSSDTYAIDTRMPPVPWTDKIYNDTRPLRFGYYLAHEELFPVTPACTNVVLEVKEALEKRGHEVIPWAPVRPYMAEQSFLRAACGDNGKHLAEFMMGDIPNECTEMYFKYQLGDETSLLTKFRIWLKKMSKSYDARIRSYFTSPGTVIGWWDLTAAVENWRSEWNDAMKEAGLDAILCPGSAFPPPKNHKDTWKQCFYAMTHWGMYNALDIPCGAISVRKTTQEDVAEMEQYNPDIPKWVKDKIKREMKAGLPIGVQCASYKWQEELCLRAMKEIELAIQDTHQ